MNPIEITPKTAWACVPEPEGEGTICTLEATVTARLDALPGPEPDPEPEPAPGPAPPITIGGIPVFNVMEYGAKGNGSTNDTAALQAAIDAAAQGGSRNRGGTVYFPEGCYLVSRPLVLPRTGMTPNHVVKLQGAGMHTAQIRGIGSSWEAGEAIIQWQQTPQRTYFQSIRDLLIQPPEVEGTLAIHYHVLDKSTWAKGMAEHMSYGEFRNLQFEGSNEFQSAFIYLEGHIRYSVFDHLIGSPKRTNRKFDTWLLVTDHNIFTSYPHGGDSQGINFSILSRLGSGFRRGGTGGLFKGRLNHSTMINTWSDGVELGGPAYHIINSVHSTLENVGNEGRSDSPQILVENSNSLTFIGPDVRTPNDYSGHGIGNGLELRNADNCVFRSRTCEPGFPAFAPKGVRMIYVDADSQGNEFTHWEFTGNPTSEVYFGHPDNYFHGYRKDSPKGWVTVGKPPAEWGK